MGCKNQLWDCDAWILTIDSSMPPLLMACESTLSPLLGRLHRFKSWRQHTKLKHRKTPIRLRWPYFTVSNARDHDSDGGLFSLCWPFLHVGHRQSSKQAVYRGWKKNLGGEVIFPFLVINAQRFWALADNRGSDNRSSSIMNAILDRTMWFI